tara:strand:+ start:124 stop:672 length:549 start_codon:yes stop_codon:yes gene_type:complete
MPKMKYRFRAIFENFGVSSEKVELTKQVATIARPSVNFEPVTIDVYNSKVRLLGKPTWQDVSIKLRDDAGGNVSKLVGEQIQKQFDFAEQASASAGIDYKFVLKFEMLDGGNGANAANVLETWELYGAFVSQVNYGDMDYASNDPATIDLTIQYDNAVQTPTGTGIGSAIGRTLGTSVTGVS